MCTSIIFTRTCLEACIFFFRMKRNIFFYIWKYKKYLSFFHRKEFLNFWQKRKKSLLFFTEKKEISYFFTEYKELFFSQSLPIDLVPNQFKKYNYSTKLVWFYKIQKSVCTVCTAGCTIRRKSPHNVLCTI